MAPKTYDSTSENEQAPPLPSAPLIVLDTNIILQPPLTRRGSGPGLILVLPDPSTLNLKSGPRPLDPEPVQKWAEEGFAVAALTTSVSPSELGPSIKHAIDGLLQLPGLDTRDKIAIIVYEASSNLFHAIGSLNDLPVACLVSYCSLPGDDPINPQIPTLFHLTTKVDSPANVTVHTYPAQSQHFVLPQTSDYDPGSASLAHTRSLVFLRKWLGGPLFDLEAIWDEHCYFEFDVRSLAKTMATMVQEPYVNHVPTMTGGVGREALTAFYRDHFIYNNPDDTNLQLISRTVGANRIVDEFIFHITHDRTVDWLMPSVPPTGKKLSIPMMAVVNVRGDRLYNEHIWWDQATALRQAGILPTHVPFTSTGGVSGTLRMPVAGVECAHMLLDEINGNSNEMMGAEWGLQK